ncbi:MAG: ArdC-like ssDNA-binding domain-containing protein [Thermacetogeniaceae bacterium]
MNLERMKEALNRLLAIFESGDLPAAVARTLIQPVPGYEKPSDKWSLGNKILMLLAGTEDARGFRQWQEVGRRVKKGAKAFYILAPRTKKVKKRVVDPDTGEEREEEQTVLIGFKDIPVFRYEDTEGEPLPQPDYRPPEPPPLYEVARKFGVKEITYTPFDGRCYGFYTWGPGGKKIGLHTHDVITWFHELGHTVHGTFRTLKGGQDPEQEIVAEVFAATMCEYFGIRGYHWHAWEYVKAYSGREPQKALKAVFRVLSDVEECLRRVWEVQKGQEGSRAA